MGDEKSNSKHTNDENKLNDKNNYYKSKKDNTKNRSDEERTKRRFRISEIPNEEALKIPRKKPKMSALMVQRSKLFLNNMKQHIKEAKKELRKEQNSEKMREREEMEKKVNEALKKDRTEFKNEFRKRAEEKAKKLVEQRELDLKKTEWKIKNFLCNNLIKKLELIHKNKSNFILTKSIPQIYYKPKNMNETTNQKLEESKKIQKTLFEKD